MEGDRLHFNSVQAQQVFNYLAAGREPDGAATKEAFLEERGAALVALTPREHSFAMATLRVHGGDSSDITDTTTITTGGGPRRLPMHCIDWPV